MFLRPDTIGPTRPPFIEKWGRGLGWWNNGEL